jgi:hypothetical protein
MVVERVGMTKAGAVYRVLLDDVEIVSRTRDPECAACRAYLELNPGSEKAKVCFRRRGEAVYMEMNIGYGAKRSANEGEKQQLRFRKWRPVQIEPDGS